MGRMELSGRVACWAWIKFHQHKLSNTQGVALNFSTSHTRSAISISCRHLKARLTPPSLTQPTPPCALQILTDHTIWNSHKREHLSRQAFCSEPKPSPLHFADSQGSRHSRFPGFSVSRSSQTRLPHGSPLSSQPSPGRHA